MPVKSSKKGEKDSAETVDDSKLTGVYIFPNGDKYDGQYTRSDEGVLERSGSGTYTSKASGSVYVGTFENDKMNGMGKLTHLNGSSYEGEFANNKYHGQGKYMFSDGSSYTGPWENSMMLGLGEYTDKVGNVWRGEINQTQGIGLKFKLKNF